MAPLTADSRARRNRARLADEVAYLGYAAGWRLVRALPERRAYALFDRLADRVWTRRGRSVRQLEANLARVCPEADAEELTRMSRAALRSYGRYWCDAFRMPDWSREKIVRTFRCENVELVDTLLAQQGGLVIATAHMGNYDHTGAWAAVTGRPLTSVAERVRPEKLFTKFMAYRTRLGIRVHPHGTPDVVDILASELRSQNRVVALISDRDMSSHGIPVTFFGHTAPFPPGPAKLALLTGAPLVTATLFYDGPTSVVRIAEQIPIPPGAPTGPDAADQPGFRAAVAEITQAVATQLASGIAEKPCDWHMLARLWCDDAPEQTVPERRCCPSGDA